MTTPDLSDRTIIITGGGRGIGSAIATRLVRAGADAVVCGRTAPDLATFRDELGERGETMLSQRCDVSSEKDIGDLVAATVDRYGGVDAIVNNAAFIQMTPLDAVSTEEFDRTFAVNVRGPMLLAKAALPYLRDSPSAAIVNIASVAVDMGGPTMALYRSSKLALLGLTKVMAKEWGADGIRVNAVSPGKVDTDDAGIDEDMIELAKMATPLGRLAEQSEIADAVCYLISDQASYVTGATLTVDGGVSP